MRVYTTRGNFFLLIRAAVLFSLYPLCSKLHHTLFHEPVGDWDGKGSAPALTSCSNKKHLQYDDSKNTHQKVAAGKLVFTYGVEWRKSEVRTLISFLLLCTSCDLGFSFFPHGFARSHFYFYDLSL